MNYIFTNAAYYSLIIAVPIDFCRNYYLSENKRIHGMMYCSLEGVRSLFLALFFDKNSDYIMKWGIIYLMCIMVFFNMISAFLLYKSVKNENEEKLKQVKNKLEFQNL